MPETGKREDPFRGFNFIVLINNREVAGFRECSGLTLTTDPVEYREGSDRPLHVRKLTGLRKFTNIALKRGFTTNRVFYAWYKNTLNGVEDRRGGAVVLRNELHAEVLRFRFENAYICKWEGPMLNATSNDVAIESLELCVERIELA